jgi:polyhydroxybutyrate depolymerase
MRSRLALVALVLLLPAALQAAPPPLTLPVDGTEREYLLHAPSTLPADRSSPLVFVFHGGRGTAAGMMALSRFNAVADREGLLVVYPQGIDGGWNDGRNTNVSQAHRDNVNDLAFFDALLARLSGQYRVDPKRVFATGISNGGIFSHYLAANRAQKIAAIAPIVGGIAHPFDQQFRPAAPVSVLVIQGSADPLVPYEGGKITAGDGKDRGSVISTDAAAKLWVQANGADPEPEISQLPDRDPADGCRTQVFKWTRGQDGSAVWLYRVQGGGHTWPGGTQYLPRRFIGRVTNDFDSNEIWAFFKQHPKP